MLLLISISCFVFPLLTSAFNSRFFSILVRIACFSASVHKAVSERRKHWCNICFALGSFFILREIAVVSSLRTVLAKRIFLVLMNASVL